MAAAHRSGDPLDNKLRAEKFVAGQKSAIAEKKSYRLHYQDEPIGLVIMATPMEAEAWNRNSRAYFCHQATLGRECLPVLIWKEVRNESLDLVWRVIYTLNGKAADRLVSAKNKTDATREFNKTASVAARIVSVEPDKDLTAAVKESAPFDAPAAEDDTEF